MTDTVWALTYDRDADPWETTVGFRKRRVPRPRLDASSPEDGASVLVRPVMTGVCGTDRGIWHRAAFRELITGSLEREARSTRVLGHEMLGQIVEVGVEARRTLGFEPGEMVTTESHIVCGVCYQCRRGESHVCADEKIIGISQDGCFTELIKLPARALWRTDITKIRPEVAAIQEPFGNAVHACTRVDLAGQRVAIFGCGPIGLFSVAVARARGAERVVGVEPLPRNAEMARRLGADDVLAPGPQDPRRPHAADRDLARRLRELTGGVGVDVALEMTGVHSSVNNAIASVRRGGHVILFGLKGGDAVIEGFDRLIVNGITLHGIVGRRIFETWQTTRRLLESQELRLQDQIFEVILNRGEGTIFDFERFEPTAFEEAMSRHAKIVIRYGAV